MNPHSIVAWMSRNSLVELGVNSRSRRDWTHLNFRFSASFEQGVPWHSSNWVLIYSKMRTWHTYSQNIQARTYSQMHCTDKYSQYSSVIWPVCLNGWVFIYELSGCGFESSYSHLIFRFCTCSEQWVPWHSGNYKVWIHSETRTWHEKKIHLIFLLHSKFFWYSFRFFYLLQIHFDIYLFHILFSYNFFVK